MITTLSNFIGYVCPVCMSGIGQEVGIFRIPKKEPLVLSCKEKSCKEDVVRITQTPKGYRVEVFCVLCREMHAFDVKKSIFWQDRLYKLCCPNTDIEILFLGEKEQVIDAMHEQEALFRDFSDNMAIEQELSILFEIVTAINEKAKNCAISCNCGSEDIMVNVEDVGITLTCKTCGSEQFYGANRQDLESILNVSTIVLHK
ncbi:MAG: hypothetical protein E7397_07475 [Ruminococcaceae bacterium]|nr:hypothetical protein [Oscillospiraceae bacterium]